MSDIILVRIVSPNEISMLTKRIHLFSGTVLKLVRLYVPFLIIQHFFKKVDNYLRWYIMLVVNQEVHL